MDNPDYDMRLYTLLERIVHAAHMQEVWQKAGYIFKNMAEQKSIPDDVCVYMRDSERNGILEMLRLIALKVREPSLMYGKHVKMGDGHMDWSGNLYTYHFVDKDPNQIVKNQPEPLPHLKTEDDWNTWTTQMQSMGKDMEEYSRYMAMYMQCVL